MAILLAVGATGIGIPKISIVLSTTEQLLSSVIFTKYFIVATPPGNDGLAGKGLVVLCETPLYVQLNVSGVVTPRCPVKRTTGRTEVTKVEVKPQPAAPVEPIATAGAVATDVNTTLWVVPVPDALQNSNTTFETPSQANGVVNTILLVPKPVAATPTKAAGPNACVAAAVMAL